MKKYIVFGAKSIALGVCLAIQELYEDMEAVGFLVSQKSGNPSVLANLPVYSFEDDLDRTLTVYIGTPEDVHPAVINTLTVQGFMDYVCVDSKMEADLMERYYKAKGLFLSVHGVPLQMALDADFSDMFEVYLAKFHKDKVLNDKYMIQPWMKQIQAGAALTDIRVADVLDCTGDNISEKNVNYCELTALYWIWKNRLSDMSENDEAYEKKYYGLFHYRRMLELSDADIARIISNHIDVVLPFPTVHEPDISEHPLRYIAESDMMAVLKALHMLYPEYYETYKTLCRGNYLYNYNILVAKAGVLRAYCEWLFPILELTEELSNPKGSERADRYIGYIGETLLTVYFMHNSKSLNIYHTGRILLC